MQIRGQYERENDPYQKMIAERELQEFAKQEEVRIKAEKREREAKIAERRIRYFAIADGSSFWVAVMALWMVSSIHLPTVAQLVLVGIQTMGWVFCVFLTTWGICYVATVATDN